MQPRDTSPEAWAIVKAGVRNMTPADRVARALSLTILAHSMALAKIRRDHPDEGDRAHRLRLAARMIDAKTMRAAFDWPPSL
jgi:hypothetical protein